jgi:hypothetical protein
MSAEPAGQEPFSDPPGLRPSHAAPPADHGVGMCWAADVGLEDVLAAADRLRRTRRGQDLPAWGEPERAAKGGSGRLTKAHPAAAGNPSPPAGNPASQDPANRDPEDEGPRIQDPLAEDELRAAEAGAGQPMLSSEMAGHVRMPPGPALAAWLGQAQPDQLDEAALVNSITGWRKLTSWAQAQELAAVAELGRRRGVMDDPELDRDPARELSAEFAPNEVALALTLTQFAAEWWMNLAVSLSRRLPGTWSALSQGTIDLGRAKLIDAWTTPLDDDLAGAVEGKVLPRAGQQTTGQLRASLQRAVISADPAAAERRRTEAEKKARVELAGEDSGTAALSGHYLPAAQASAAWTRISGMAEAMKGDGAGGGIDLLRAQVFVGLLLGTLPQPPGANGPDGPDGANGPDGAGNPGPPGASRDDGGTSLGDGGTDTPDGDQDDDPGSGPGGEPAPEVPPSGNDLDDHPPDEPANGDTGQGPRQGVTKDQPWCWPPIPAPGEVPWPDASSRKAKVGRPELTVSWRTLAGWWDEPGQLTRMGAITAEVARALARAASADPTCLWRVVVTDTESRVVTVTRIHWPGHSYRKSDHPPGSDADQPAADAHSPGSGVPGPGRPGPGVPGPGVLGRITVTVPVMLLGEPLPVAQGGLNTSAELAAALQAILATATTAAREVGRADGDHADSDHADGDHADGSSDVPCTHANAASGYRIPDRMRDLIEVRDQDCGFPICRRPASRCDLDHTVPYDQGGPTCPCNISPGCRHDHRMKGSTAWRLRQPRAGTLVWTAPSGLSWTVTPQPQVA